MPVRVGFKVRLPQLGIVCQSKLFSSMAKFNQGEINKLYRAIRPWSHVRNMSESSAKGLADQVMKANLDKESSSDASQDSEKSKKEKEEKKRADAFQKRMMKYTFISFGAMFVGMAVILVNEWGAPLKDPDGNDIPDEYTDLPKWKAYLYRSYREMKFYDKMIKDPSREKLLPDPLTEPYYQPPYTLVLEMTGILIHPEWTYQTGWRFKKRPAVNFFLQQVGPPLFEVVIYTAEQGLTAFPILDTLDPQGFIMYRLFRDATRYLKGHHVKDLSCLNRDLSKVIFIEWDPNSFQLQPENTLKLKKWNGNDDDRTLLDLAIFLRTIASSGVEDVRTVLDYYSQFDDPLEAFRENQRKLAERTEQQKSEDEIREKQALTSAWKGNLFRGR